MTNTIYDKRHAFLIMAHNNWYVLERLMQLLDAEWIDIYLHIDKKAEDFDSDFFKRLCKNANVIMVKRHNVTWGNETQITAEMELFRAAYKNRPYWYYHLLSGSDLPLQPLNEIYNFFCDKQINFLNVQDDVETYTWRLKSYINIFRQTWIPQSIQRKLNVYSEIIQNKLKINRLDKLRKYFPIIGYGYNWCDLNEFAVKALIANERKLKKFTKFTHCSDELYKQTVLLSQDNKIIGQIADLPRLIDWNNTEEKGHPRIWQYSDLNIILNSHHLFARKFSTKTPPHKQLVDYIFINLNKENEESSYKAQNRMV